jgi:hypothetical protein
VRRAMVALVALASAASAAAPAQAGPRQESVFQDDNLLLYRGDRTSDRTFAELRELGVDRVRLSVPWRALAPAYRATTKPRPLRYEEADFHPWDHAVRAARARGIEVLFNVTGGAPLWATGKRDGRRVSRQYKPSPREFEAFVAMLGRRYDGDHGHPRVEAWSIWNEPNFGSFLQPQWENGRPASPGIYRGLVRAAVRGLRRSGHDDDIVLLGETSPYGVDRRGSTTPMRPALFLRELLCLDEDLLPATKPGCATFDAEDGRFDVTGYAHHPYPIVSPPDEPSPNPDDIKLADAARLTAVLDAAAGRGRIPPELPLWYTEFGYQTPPDPIRGIPLTEHAAWLAKAERMTWLDDRVAAHTQFQMKDDPPRRQFDSDDPRYWGTYQAGLRFSGGRAKPAYNAYRLPLDAPARVPPGQPLRLWGFVRAAPNGDSTQVQLEHKAPGSDRFVAVGDPVFVYDTRGYFETEAPRMSGSWRYTWRGHASNAVGVYVG